MNYNKIIRNLMMSALAMFAVSSCSEEVNYGNVDVPETGDGSELLYVTDAQGSAASPSVEYRGTAGVDLYAASTQAVSAAQTFTFSYDADALTTYNAQNGTSFEAVPQSMVSLSNAGTATIAAGQTKSEPMTLTLTSDGSLDHEATYVVPLKVTATGALASAAKTVMVFVRDLTALPDCNKTWVDDEGVEHPGVKIFSCMEVNDTNPLNNLRFTLKNSGKYMVDALIIFAGNINYNSETSRVYFNANPNVQHLLDNRETLLKPLQDRGMKVIMGVMCNHDRACIANLAPETAKEFAAELNALSDAYHLDGMFWDDEYCSPIYPAPPGFVSPSNEAWSRLAYEYWKLNPTRWNVAYGYSRTGYGTNIDGVPAGKFITYVLPDYGASYSDSYMSSFEGMERWQIGGSSMQMNYGNYGSSESSLRTARNNGYGALMVFAMDPYRRTEYGQEQAMGKLARAFYDDEVVVDPHRYPKDY